MSYKLSDLNYVSDAMAKSLQAVGIGDTDQLLLVAANSDERKALAAKLGISEQMLMAVANRADLLRVSGIGPAYTELLNAVGINSMADLRAAGPGLFDQLSKAGATLGIKGPPSSSDVSAWVNAAQTMPDAADWAIATKSDALRAGFESADWMKIKLAPLAAASLVAAASPSDSEGSASEMWAAAAALNNARAGARPEALINVAFPEDLSADDIANFMTEMPPTDMLGTIAAAAALASQHVDPAQLAAYQTMILDVAQKAALGAKEGGFLGLGKKLVSPEEQAVLDQIRTAVGA